MSISRKVDRRTVLKYAGAATLAGAKSCVEMAEFGEAKEALLRQVLELPHGIPSHDTFRRVFCLLDPVAFQGCFSGWMTSLMARYGLTPVSPGRHELRPVAIDGKAQRGSARRTVGRSPSHGVSARAVDNLGATTTTTPISIRVDPAGGGGAAPALHVSGNKLLTAAGATYRLLGVNRASAAARTPIDGSPSSASPSVEDSTRNSTGLPSSWAPTTKSSASAPRGTSDFTPFRT